MDFYKAIDKNTTKTDVISLKNAGYEGVRVVGKDQFADLVQSLIDEETKKIQKDRDKFKKKAESLQNKVDAQMEVIKEISSVQLDLSPLTDQLTEMKSSLKEEIQRQMALATVSKEGKNAVVDMEAFLDSLFKGDELETNLKNVKVKTLKAKSSGALKKLREMEH